MSRIDELIAEHCPDGVPHKTLGEVIEYARGRIASSELVSGEYVGVENLLQNCGGRIQGVISQKIPENIAGFEEGDVLIGNIRPYLKKIWLADSSGGASGDVLVLRRKPECISLLDSTFLFFVLSSDNFFNYSNQFARGAGMPRGDKAAILRYIIPIPPLEVQLEIVRILDAMTSLQAELAARRSQYEFYRDSLLSFNDAGTPPLEVDDVG